LAFFIFGSFFLSIRILIMGSAGSVNLPQFVLSALPELFASMILFYFIQRKNKSLQWTRFNNHDKFFIFFICMNLLLGSIVSGEIKLIIYGIRMTYFPMLFYFIARFENDESIAKLVHSIFTWFSYVGMIGLAMYFFMYDQMIDMILITGGEVAEYFITRMTSIFWTPVVFSTFMSMVFIYFYWRFLVKGEKQDCSHMAITWLCLLLSVSRGSLVVVLLGLIIISIFCFHRKRVLVSLLLLTILFMAVAFYIGSPIEYIQWLLSSTAETLSLKEGVTRVDLWINAFENFKDHPFGYGIGKSGHVAARFFAQDSTQADVFSTDGWFLKLANETGIAGLLTYFVLAFSLLIGFIKAKFYKHDDLIMLFTFFIMFNVQNLVSNVFDFYLFAFLYWMLMGITVFKFQQMKMNEAKG
jgi:hypothetical protein